jgi:hypothetical protein
MLQYLQTIFFASATLPESDSDFHLNSPGRTSASASATEILQDASFWLHLCGVVLLGLSVVSNCKLFWVVHKQALWSSYFDNLFAVLSPAVDRLRALRVRIGTPKTTTSARKQQPQPAVNNIQQTQASECQQQHRDLQQAKAKTNETVKMEMGLKVELQPQNDDQRGCHCMSASKHQTRVLEQMKAVQMKGHAHAAPVATVSECGTVGDDMTKNMNRYSTSPLPSTPPVLAATCGSVHVGIGAKVSLEPLDIALAVAVGVGVEVEEGTDAGGNGGGIRHIPNGKKRPAKNWEGNDAEDKPRKNKKTSSKKHEKKKAKAKAGRSKSRGSDSKENTPRNLLRTKASLAMTSEVTGGKRKSPSPIGLTRKTRSRTKRQRQVLSVL